MATRNHQSFRHGIPSPLPQLPQSVKVAPRTTAATDAAAIGCKNRRRLRSGIAHFNTVALYAGGPGGGSQSERGMTWIKTPVEGAVAPVGANALERRAIREGG
jgi:hypothetical protein